MSIVGKKKASFIFFISASSSSITEAKEKEYRVWRERREGRGERDAYGTLGRGVE